MFENEWNHIHLETLLGHTIEERWRNNLILTRAVKEIWKERLKAQFPHFDFALVIFSELCVDADGKLLEVQPTLKLWTINNDEKLDLWHTFQADCDYSDYVNISENYTLHFVKAAEFFANLKSGLL